MADVTFKGGVFPHKRKRFTREKALEEYRPKGDLVYPLRQHIGGTAVPVVTVGDRVLRVSFWRRPAAIFPRRYTHPCPVR